jgi:UDP-N-acetylglucosamine/UDP-N-acetylgalactosamine 4-epimerase
VNALVTGGAGFIGAAVAQALVNRGDSVRVIDNLVSGEESNVPPGAEFILGDLRDRAAMSKACEGTDVVFHQAAIRSVPRSVDDPLLSNDANVSGTLNLLVAASEAGVDRLIYASSSSVYGNIDAGVNRETLAPDPESPYAVSKLAGEYYCRVWARLKGLSTVSLRYFNVFGPGQRAESKYATVFPAFIKALLNNDPPEVHWDGEQARDFSYIDDVVRANLLAAESDSRVDGAVVNIGAGYPRTVNEVLRSVSDAVGVWIEPTSSPKRAGDVRTTHADISLALQLLGWKPETDWDEAVGETVAWFRNRISNSS